MQGMQRLSLGLMQGRVAVRKGLFERDWSELVWKKMVFFFWKTGRLGDSCYSASEFCPSTLLPKSMSGQRTSWLSLPSPWELPGRQEESHRQCWAPKLISGPPSPGRGVHEENKENPACLGSWKSEDDFHTRAPGKLNDSLLSSQLATGFFLGGSSPQHSSLSSSPGWRRWRTCIHQHPHRPTPPL